MQYVLGGLLILQKSVHTSLPPQKRRSKTRGLSAMNIFYGLFLGNEMGFKCLPATFSHIYYGRDDFNLALGALQPLCDLRCKVRLVITPYRPGKFPGRLRALLFVLLPKNNVPRDCCQKLAFDFQTLVRRFALDSIFCRAGGAPT
jgi:hypothetical protein